MTGALDRSDRQLIAALRSAPRSSIAQLARTIGVARGTVHTRLARMQERGVIRGYGPDIDAGAAGYDVRAFTTLAIAQGAHERTISYLRAIPEILEVHTITGGGDLLLRIVAQTNEHLHQVLQRVASIPDATRTETHLALATPIQRSVADLIAEEGQ